MTRQLLEYIGPWLVDNPDELQITEAEGDRGALVIEVSVDPADMGKLIGRARADHPLHPDPRSCRRTARRAERDGRGGGLTGAPQRLLVGQIGKPHGLAGDVYVVRISDDPHRFDPGATLLHEDGRLLVVASSRSHRTRFLVRFEGLVGREAAESLRGALYVDSAEARRLEPGEYWEHELVGAEVLRIDGSPVGRVSAVEAGPGQDRLVVATPAGERLIPVVEEIVVEVDRDARRVVVDPPDGLLD